MSTLIEQMRVVDMYQIPKNLSSASKCNKSTGGLLTNSQYVWFVDGPNVIIYSKSTKSILAVKSFEINQNDKSFKITSVKELITNMDPYKILLIGCSFKSSTILYVCQLPTLNIIHSIELPDQISCISTIVNESFSEEQLCDKLKIMSNILIVGMVSGAVYTIDFKQNYIKNKLKANEIIVNNVKPTQLCFIKKNDNIENTKFDDNNEHLAMLINENFLGHCKKKYGDKLNFNITSLQYIEKINTIAIGYSTGHYQLWDCKFMCTISVSIEPKCIMPITHFGFIEPIENAKDICYLWIIQSDNSKLPNATMMAVTYKEKTIMSNGSLIYNGFQECSVKLEIFLKMETGIGHCISICNSTAFNTDNALGDDYEIRLFFMLMEVRQHANANPESYLFLFDIKQWYKANMPSMLNNFNISNSYASFVKFPYIKSYLDFNIADQTLRPFGSNFRSDIEELHYPSSIYFECVCLSDTEIITFKHAGIQQEILDQLLLKSWKLLINPSYIFSQCLQTNLNPFFWDKQDDFINYSLSDKRSYVISILVENKMMFALRACADEWRNGTYITSEATILHLIQCLWNHIIVVKQYADKLIVPLFNYSGVQLDKKNKIILNHCLSQMRCVKLFFDSLYSEYNFPVMNVYSFNHTDTLNLVIEYFKIIICFINFGLLPESLEDVSIQLNIPYDLTSLMQYANERRIECGHLKLYLIDAIVNNQQNGNKLVEQWLQEGGYITNGMYPPPNVQCLLRIYLNAALSNKVKNYIIIYFLIDIFSTYKIEAIVSNCMPNFAFEFHLGDNELNSLCYASWLLDHDMFEDAMKILNNITYWLKNNEISQEWFHWTVLKLCVFKSQYAWAIFYFNLIGMKMVKIEDHKFYIYIHIMNDQCINALNYIHTRPIEEKQILFSYLINQCKQSNKLKCLLDGQWGHEGEKIFISHLRNFNDAEALIVHLSFLLQRRMYLEAGQLTKYSESIIQSNLNNQNLVMISQLAKKYEQRLPEILKQKFEGPCLNTNNKQIMKLVDCNDKIMDEKKDIYGNITSSDTSSKSMNLIPTSNDTLKRSPIHLVLNEKRRKMNDDTDKLSLRKTNNNIVPSTEKIILSILNTPLVKKVGPINKDNQLSPIRNHEISMSQPITQFHLPNNNISKIEQNNTSMPKAESQVHEIIYNIHSNATKNSIDQIMIQPTEMNFEKLFNDCYKMDISKKYCEHNFQIDQCKMNPNLFTDKPVLSIPDNVKKNKDTYKVNEYVIYEDRNLEINQFCSINTEENFIKHIQPDIQDDLSLDNKFKLFENKREAKMSFLDSDKMYEYSNLKNENLTDIDGNKHKNNKNETEHVVLVSKESTDILFDSACNDDKLATEENYFENPLYNQFKSTNEKLDIPFSNIISVSDQEYKNKNSGTFLSLMNHNKLASSNYVHSDEVKKLDNINNDVISLNSEKQVNFTSLCNLPVSYNSNKSSVISLDDNNSDNRSNSSQNKSNTPSSSDLSSIHYTKDFCNNFIDKFSFASKSNNEIINTTYTDSSDIEFNAKDSRLIVITTMNESENTFMKSLKTYDFGNNDELAKNDKGDLVYDLTLAQSKKFNEENETQNINKSVVEEFNKDIENLNTLKQKENDVETIYSNSLIPTITLQNDSELHVRANDLNTIMDNEQIINFNIRAQEDLFNKLEHINTNSVETNYISFDYINNIDKIYNTQNDTISVDLQDCSNTYFESLSQIPNHGFNLHTTETESSPPKTSKIDDHQLNSLSYSESDFDQMYLFANEIIVNNQTNKPETQDLITDIYKEVAINEEFEVVPVDNLDEIELNPFKICPEFSLTQNSVSQKYEEMNKSYDNQSSVILHNSRLSNAIYENKIPKINEESLMTFQEFNDHQSMHQKELYNTDNIIQNNVNIHQTEIVTTMETKYENISYNILNDKKNKNSWNSSNAKEKQTCSNPKKNIEASSEQKEFSWPTIIRSKHAKSVIHYSDNKHSNNLLINTLDSSLQQKLVKPEESDSKPNSILPKKKLKKNDLCKTVDPNLNNQKLKHIESMKSKDIIYQKIDNSILDSAKVEQINETQQQNIYKSDDLCKNETEETSSKNILNETNETNSVQESSKLEISVTKQSNFKTVDRRNSKAKSKQAFEKIAMNVKKPLTLHTSPSDDKLKHFQKFVQEKPQTLMAKNKKHCQNNFLNTSRRISIRKSTAKSKDCHSCSFHNTVEKCKESTLKLYISKNTNRNYTSQHKKANRVKAIPSPNANIVVTKSKTQTNSSKVDSVNIFRTSETDDNSKRVKMTISRKKLKTQQNKPPIKRRTRRCMPVKDVVTTIDLVKVAEEVVLNKDVKIRRPSKMKKSKFNFVSETSKKTNPVQVLTPPILTSSCVKTKPEKSAEVESYKIAGKSLHEKDTSVSDLQKNLMLPTEIKKRSLSMPMPNRKQRKTTMNVKNVTEYHCNGSNENVKASTFPNKSVVLVNGDTFKRRKFVPKKIQTKVTANVNVECNLNVDEAISSKCVNIKPINKSNLDENCEETCNENSLVAVKTVKQKGIGRPRKSSICKQFSPKKTVAIINTSDEKNIKATIGHRKHSAVPFNTDRRITRLQQAMLEKSLTSDIGHDDSDNSVPVPETNIKKNKNSNNRAPPRKKNIF